MTDLPEWKHEENKLVRTITFPSFMRAIQFVNAVAHLAERQDHHPDIHVEYHRVTIRYWTHTAKGVTDLDFTGAKEVEAMIAPFKKEPVTY
jgi:4a-hydroxytetrahydrobiopterin dehydratase